MQTIDRFGEAYLSLCFQIDHYIDGYVDAYIGPPEIKAKAQAAGKKPVEALLADLESLRVLIPPGDPARAAYLEGMLRSMGCALRKQSGEEIDYIDEVACLYDIHPERIDEAAFQAAHRELDGLLPGSGDLSERMQAWRKRYEIPAGKLLGLLEMARDETRKRTRTLFDLVEGEDFELKLVSDQPWSGYNWYLGDGRSRIEINTDIPVSALRLLELVAHEGYPGHHTEGQLKEQRLYREKGYAEAAISPLLAPNAVISEAIATTALEIIFPGGEAYEWNAGVLFPAAGIDGDSVDALKRIAAARDRLKYVAGNAALLFHGGELTEAQAVDYLATYDLSSQARAEQRFKFISSPLFRSYIFTYTAGYDLITQAAADGDKLPVFRRLLTGQVLPSALAGD